MTQDSKIRLLHDNEQKIQRILENEREELNAFLYDHLPEVEKYYNVKAFIAFSLSHHYASQMPD